MDLQPGNHNPVVNLSKFRLDEQHISLLSRGLKFCPTPGPPDPGEQRDDMDRLHKRLHQIAHYEGSMDDTGILIPSQPDPLPPADNGLNLHSPEPFKHKKFRCKSTGRGPIGPTNLEAMIACNEYQYNNRPAWRSNKRNNLTPSERLALKELRTNDNIII